MSRRRWCKVSTASKQNSLSCFRETIQQCFSFQHCVTECFITIVDRCQLIPEINTLSNEINLFELPRECDKTTAHRHEYISIIADECQKNCFKERKKRRWRSSIRTYVVGILCSWERFRIFKLFIFTLKLVSIWTTLKATETASCRLGGIFTREIKRRSF